MDPVKIDVTSSFQYQLLLGVSEIQNYYTTTAVHCLYDDIGQVLSLIRLRLSHFSDKAIKVDKANLAELSEQAAKAILTTRKLSGFLWLDNTIVKNENWINAIAEVIAFNFPLAKFQFFDCRTNDLVVGREHLLVLFSLFLGLVTLVKQAADCEMAGVELHYGDNDIRFLLYYNGHLLGYPEAIRQRIKIIGAQITSDKTEANKWLMELQAPLNIRL